MSQPPQSIVIEAGSKAGFFASTADFLKSTLKQYGIDATVIYKKDTTNIISRVDDINSGSHVGFSAQDLGEQEFKNLHSLGAVILEPLLFFVRSDSNINNLSDFQGMRIALGPPKSGARILATEIIKNYNITSETADISPLQMHKAIKALEEGDLDVITFLLPVETEILNKLSKDENFKVVKMEQAQAIRMNYKYLDAVNIPQAAFSLVNNLPRENFSTVALPVSLVIKKDFSSSLEVIIAYELMKKFRKETLLTKKGSMPKNYFDSIPMSKQVENLYNHDLPLFLEYFPLKVSLIILSLIPKLSIMVMMYFILGIAVWYADIYFLLEEIKNRNKENKKIRK
jgi:hypothetical protein